MTNQEELVKEVKEWLIAHKESLLLVEKTRDIPKELWSIYVDHYQEHVVDKIKRAIEHSFPFTAEDLHGIITLTFIQDVYGEIKPSEELGK